MLWIEQGGFFMLPLVVCSIIGMAVILERFFAYGRIMKIPLIKYDSPPDIVKMLRMRMMTMSTLITISPMLGLLGTVTGLMKCFRLLSGTAVVRHPKEMSLGISEALVTTAAGLIIAVTVTVFYNYFASRLDSYLFDYDTACEADRHA
ncbi:MAG: MotA/TolQ/ExbB proton channel family protein [Bacillota bacterium]